MKKIIGFNTIEQVLANGLETKDMGTIQTGIVLLGTNGDYSAKIKTSDEYEESRGEIVVRNYKTVHECLEVLDKKLTSIVEAEMHSVQAAQEQFANLQYFDRVKEM